MIILIGFWNHRVETMRFHCASQTAIFSAMSAILKDDDYSAMVLMAATLVWQNHQEAGVLVAQKR